MENSECDSLNIGDKSIDSRIEIVDKDRLCYLVKVESRGAYGIRTISKQLLSEYITPIRDKIAISCMLRQIHEFSSHAIRHGLYIKNRKRLFCP